jgi:hypothetical protein
VAILGIIPFKLQYGAHGFPTYLSFFTFHPFWKISFFLPSFVFGQPSSQLRHQMTEEGRQRNDTEMENWAVEHERR